jgi:hypothetical protein
MRVGFETGAMASWLWHELNLIELPSTALGTLMLHC